MVPRAYTIVGIAAAALVSTLVAASLSSGSLLGRQHVATPGSPTPAPPPHHPRSSAPGGTGIPTWLTVSMTVLLAVYALGLLVLVALSRRRRKDREDPLRLPMEEARPSSPWETVLSVDLGNAAEEQLAALRRGTPRNAIVACWMGLQAATHGAGLPESRSETPDEFMLRAMRSLELDPPSITALSALYREARFSDHLMVEEQRQQAGQALRVLADQLMSRRTGAAAERMPDGVSR
jgi:Domain of unknown function (DUF4129)